MPDMSPKASRELDALIAEKVMGLVVRHPYGRFDPWFETTKAVSGLSPVPPYSTSIADAWLVVEKLVELATDVSISRYEDAVGFRWHCSYGYSAPDKGSIVGADTASLAICLAALRAMGVENA